MVASGRCPHLHFWFWNPGVSRDSHLSGQPTGSGPRRLRVGANGLHREDIRAGQEAFLTYGLMQYGSVYGHGAYLGPDFTADYLHRSALEMHRAYGGDARKRRSAHAASCVQNRYDPATDVLTWTDAQAKAFDVLRQHYEAEVLNRQKSGGGGLGPHAIRDPAVSRQIVAFIAWTAWTAAARRPGKPHSYTNNWPPEDARRQSPDARGSRVERALDHRSAGRDRPAADATSAAIHRSSAGTSRRIGACDFALLPKYH